MMKYNSKNKKQVAANLLARSIASLFPKIKICRAGKSKKGFFCICKADHPLDQQALRMIEEELQRSIQECLPIESVEMMRENAATLFKHHHQEYFAKEVLTHPSNIVELLSVGNFYGICPFPHPGNTKELGVVKLFKKEVNEGVCIEGIIRPDRKALKIYIRNLSSFNSHRKIGSEAALFAVDHSSCLWMPRGELVREVLVSWWKESHRQMGFGIIRRNGDLKIDASCFQYGNQIAEISDHKQVDAKSFEGGLFDLPIQTTDLCWWALDESSAVEKVNSYLHFIKKTIKIIPIDSRWIFYTKRCQSNGNQNKGGLSAQILDKALGMSNIEADFQTVDNDHYSAVEVVYTDALGRKWLGPRIELQNSASYLFNRSKTPFIMVGSLFRSLESVIAILLEATNGTLPFWLLPEQVRVLPVKEADIDQAQKMASAIKLTGCRVSCKDVTAPLSERVYNARKCKVPYIVIVGKKEREESTIAVNCYSEGEENRVISFELFMEELHRLNKTRLTF